MTLVEVRHLRHVFPDGTEALRDVSLSIDEGEFIVLAGRNGSGKTALMLHLNGLLAPTSGEVLYRGFPVSSDLRLVRQRIGVVFQDPDNQFIGQTVEDDIAFGPRNLGLSRDEVASRVDDALADVDAAALRQRRPFALSGGERRKIALAGVLAMQPELIVLDEPFASLDLYGVKMVLTEVVKLHRQHHTVIVITHEIDKVLAHATRLIVMEDGRIVANGTPEELYHDIADYGVRVPTAEDGCIKTMTWLK